MAFHPDEGFPISHIKHMMGLGTQWKFTIYNFKPWSWPYSRVCTV